MLYLHIEAMAWQVIRYCVEHKIPLKDGLDRMMANPQLPQQYVGLVCDASLREALETRTVKLIGEIDHWNVEFD